MRVLLSAQIRRREFGKSIPAEDLPVIARSARAALAVPIAAKGLPAGTRLLKAYATSPRGAKVQARSVAPRADWKTATRRSWAACTSSSLRVRSAAR